MTSNGLAKFYDKLTPLERVPLIIEENIDVHLKREIE